MRRGCQDEAVTRPDPSELWKALPGEARAFLTALRNGAEPSARLALVGGAVRDLLLAQSSASPDLDVVLEGGDTEALARNLGAPFTFHPAYGNATLRLPEGLDADLVRARTESYPLPGGPPNPGPGTLEDDLARRDFSINAFALELLPHGKQRLLSVPGGLSDLEARQLRPLHALSFHDDASRLVRGARLAARLVLHAHPELLAQVPAALEVAPQTPRLAAELRLLLEEPLPGKAARVLEGWGAAELLPAGAADLLERLDVLPGSKTRTLYAAALLSLTRHPGDLDALGLGLRPAELLTRARSGQVFPAGSAEATLHLLLGWSLPYAPLQGRDLLEMGLTPGPDLGRMLGWLAGQRRDKQFLSAEEERNAVLERMR